VFLNGTQVGATFSDSTSLATGGVSIASRFNAPTQVFPGYISNFRVVKGTAVYTANFTPSTTPLTAITNTSLLTCQSNRFIDNSTNAFAITRNGDVSVQAFSPFNPTAAWSAATYGGSGYFDGSGDYLALPINNAFQLGTGDCCVEAWIYTTSTADQAIWDIRDSTTTFGNPSVAFQTLSGALAFFSGNYSGASPVASGGTIATNTWTHVAFTRSSGTNSLYVNGTRVATNTNVWNQSGTAAFNWVGQSSFSSSSRNFVGFISDFRIVKGSAVYTGATITVPTAPLTAITNTSFLANFTNAGIYDATSKNDLETVGNAQISTAQSKFGGSSMYFDGDDKLVGRTSPNLNMGSGDFTVECWAYWAGTTTSYQNLVGSNSSSFTGNATFFRVWGTTVATLGSKVGIGNPTHDGTSSVYSVSSLAANTWTHVAATRYNGIIRLFINGVLERTGSSDTSTYDFGDNGICVGQAPWDGAAGYYTGYIDDLRITKGIARYTSNFTPPTTAFLTL
jgi:hypothetical protein